MTVKRVVSERTGKVSWRARFSYISDEDGKRKQPSETFRLKKDAEAWLVRQRSDYMAGETIDVSTLPFQEYATNWMIRHRRSIRESSAQIYQWAWTSYVRGKIGWKPIGSIRPGDIQQLYDSLGEQGMAPRSIQFVHSLLSQIFASACADKLIRLDPTVHRTLPKVDSVPVTYWSREELETFFETSRGHATFSLWYLLATSGLRIGEAIVLTWGDLDESRRALRINKTARRNEYGAFVVGKGAKSQSSNRIVFLPASTIMELRMQRERSATILTTPLDEHSLIFPLSSQGEIIPPQNFRSIFNTLVKRSGVTRITPHGLRHTYATLAIRNGMNMKILQRQLGHATLAMTMDLYAHVDEDTQALAMETMDELFPTPENIIQFEPKNDVSYE